VTSLGTGGVIDLIAISAISRPMVEAAVYGHDKLIEASANRIVRMVETGYKEGRHESTFASVTTFAETTLCTWQIQFVLFWHKIIRLCDIYY